MTIVRPEPTPIPTPEDFPFEWQNEGDSKIAWVRDLVHFPDQMTPLALWLNQHHHSPGATAGFAAYGSPLVFNTRRVNTYYYRGMTLGVPPDQLAEAGKRSGLVVKAAIPNFGRRWDQEWLPEIRDFHKKWDSIDLGKLSDAELLDHLEWSLVTYRRMWGIHFELMSPMLLAQSTFLDIYNELFEDAGELDVYKLLQGFESCSLITGWKIWELSQHVKQSDELVSIVRNTATENLMNVLSDSDAGREFAAEIRTFLDEWGNRGDTNLELGNPLWSEEPTVVIEHIKNNLNDDSTHPRDKWLQLVSERERLVTDARNQISSYPEPVKQQFEELMAASQRAQQLHEDHNWWIDQRGPSQIRLVYLEFGRRLAKSGAIAVPNDVFMLLGDEVVEAASSGLSVDLNSLVAERQADLVRWRDVTPPLEIGVKSSAPPDSPVAKALGRFSGKTSVTEEDAQSGVLTGSPASSGKITGIARVITVLSDAGRLNSGEILVTSSTLPPWTPLFAVAGGIVTDAGGALSHAAIVAREYGIPAVTGTVVATKRIKDGQRIEVDGDAGTVRLLDA